MRFFGIMTARSRATNSQQSPSKCQFVSSSFCAHGLDDGKTSKVGSGNSGAFQGRRQEQDASWKSSQGRSQELEGADGQDLHYDGVGRTLGH